MSRVVLMSLMVLTNAIKPMEPVKQPLSLRDTCVNYVSSFIKSNYSGNTSDYLILASKKLPLDCQYLINNTLNIQNNLTGLLVEKSFSSKEELMASKYLKYIVLYNENFLGDSINYTAFKEPIMPANINVSESSFVTLGLAYKGKLQELFFKKKWLLGPKKMYLTIYFIEKGCATAVLKNFSVEENFNIKIKESSGRLAIGNGTKIYLWNPLSHTLIIAKCSVPLQRIKFYPDSDMISGVDKNNLLTAWNCASGKRIYQKQLSLLGNWYIQFSLSKDFLLIRNMSTLDICNKRTGKTLKTIDALKILSSIPMDSKFLDKKLKKHVHFSDIGNYMGKDFQKKAHLLSRYFINWEYKRIWVFDRNLLSLWDLHTKKKIKKIQPSCFEGFYEFKAKKI